METNPNKMDMLHGGCFRRSADDAGGSRDCPASERSHRYTERGTGYGGAVLPYLYAGGPSGVLRSLGHTIIPSVITILGTVVFRILWIVTVFRWIPSYDMLMSVYPVSWVLTGMALIALYFAAKRKRAA